MSSGTLSETKVKNDKLIVQDNSPVAYMFDTARFEHCYRIAKVMASASLLPDHLCYDKSKKELPIEMIYGNCFMIVNQAIRWGMDPFALPGETYVVANKLGFQGKLIAAVINARAGLHGPLQTIYNNGKGDDLAAVVFGSRTRIPKEAWPLLKAFAKDESGEVYADLMALDVMCIRISVGQAKTDNKMWKSDPQQKLFYSGATKWARRHAPEFILGVLTDDDLDRMNAVQAVGNAPTIDQLALIVREEREQGDCNTVEAEQVIDPNLPENAAIPPDREEVTKPRKKPDSLLGDAAE